MAYAITQVEYFFKDELIDPSFNTEYISYRVKLNLILNPLIDFE